MSQHNGRLAKSDQILLREPADDRTASIWSESAITDPAVFAPSSKETNKGEITLGFACVEKNTGGLEKSASTSL